jgi:hypothetical protein
LCRSCASLSFECVQISLDFLFDLSYALFEHVQNCSRRSIMPPTTSQVDHFVTYYCVYLGACAILIAGLGWTFHRAGGVFLKDAFAGNTTLVGAVARLLDIGFYLVSVGYVALTYSLTYFPNLDWSWLLRIISWKVGGLMLLLGVAHLFNLLLLALFRQRRAAPTVPAAGA